jgi:glutamate dehydrogenase (NAD(P)+)
MKTFTKLIPDYYREIVEPELGLKAWVVIDRYLGGAGTGGIRLAEKVDFEEVSRLAREMTLKFSFLNIKKGGAKAGILIDSAMDEAKQKELCETFGRRIQDLLQQKKYFIGQDIGMSQDHLLAVYSGAGLFLVAQTLLDVKEESLKGAKIALEGFGKVGEELAKMFDEAGARIIAVSTVSGGLFDPEGLSVSRLCSLKKEFGDCLLQHYGEVETIAKEELFFLTADLLIPGARPDSINIENVDKIIAKTIVPVANIAATEEMEVRLYERGILYVPGFVTNCGGILGYFLNEQGFVSKDITDIIKEGFPQKIKALFVRADLTKSSVSQLARTLAIKNYQRLKFMERNPFLYIFMIQSLGYVLFKKLARKKFFSWLAPVAKKILKKRLFS